jgi:hypothetical protein
MNEKPGLEPGFFCSTSYWRPDGLRIAPGIEDRHAYRFGTFDNFCVCLKPNRADYCPHRF